MRTSIYIFALAPFVLAGCTVVEPAPTVTTTTEVRREVVTTAPGMRPVTREILVTRAPPVVRVETRTVSPGSRYVWTRGYWRWTGVNYEWVPGSWIERPRPAAVWIEGGWMRRPGGWVWVAGHWE
jgi:WXXGXW repeat (2 copies)